MRDLLCGESKPLRKKCVWRAGRGTSMNRMLGFGSRIVPSLLAASAVQSLYGTSGRCGYGPDFYRQKALSVNRRSGYGAGFAAGIGGQLLGRSFSPATRRCLGAEAAYLERQRLTWQLGRLAGLGGLAGRGVVHREKVVPHCPKRRPRPPVRTSRQLKRRRRR